jgi:hypothetical protein
MKRSGCLALGVALFFVACGGSAPPPQSTATNAPAGGADAGDGVLRPITQGQLKCAHYATGDGVIGLVLDRTGDHPKVQVDGEKDIVELTLEEDRHFGERRGWFLKRPDGRNMLYLTVNGGLTIYKGSDEFHLNSDKPADPLGAATLGGQYVEPTPSWKVAADKLNPLSVRAKFTQFKPEDSANLARVADALALATADMFFHYASHGDKNSSPYRRVVPQSFDGVSFGGVGYTSDDAWDPKAAGLAKYGGKNEGFSHYDTPRGNHMQVMTLSGYKPSLAEGAPGLVWEVNSTTAVFVTFDGDRYDVPTTQLDPGAGSPGSWPPAVQDALLDVHDVSSLAKAGAMPQKAVDDLMAADQDWTKCAAGVWAPIVKLVDQTTPASNVILIVPDAFTEATRKQYEQKARTTCSAIIKKQESMLVKLVEARSKDRLALLDKAKARLAALGLGQ